MDFLFFFFPKFSGCTMQFKKRISELRLSYKFLHFYENLGFSARYFLWSALVNCFSFN